MTTHTRRETFLPTILVLSCALALSARAQKVPVVEKTLDNGMRLLMVERHDEPTIAGGWVAHVGSSNERLGITGIAHLFEHMMFKGTTTIGTSDYKRDQEILARQEEVRDEMRMEERNMRAMLRRGDIEGDLLKPENWTPHYRDLRKQFADLVEQERKVIVKNEFDVLFSREGASGVNAFTSEDMTAYFENVPANKLELWMWMESERIFHPVFREFYAERDVVFEERRMRAESTPLGRFTEEFNAMFWQSSPYSWPTLGWPSDVSSISKAQADEFYSTFYCPQNIALILVGDFKPDDAVAMAQKYFERIPRGKKMPPDVVTLEVRQLAEKRMDAEADTNPQVDIQWHTVAFGHKDSYALQILGQILSTRTGRLYKNLVLGSGVATAVDAGQGSQKWEGLFDANGEAREGHKPEEVEQGIYENIATLQKEEVPAEELQKVKNNFSAAEYRRLSANYPILQQIIYYDGEGDWREINAEGEKDPGRHRRRCKTRGQPIFHAGKPDGGDLHAQAGHHAIRSAASNSTLNAFAMKKIFEFVLALIPKGHNENSPAFQRRDEVLTMASPEGAIENARQSGVRPSLRDLTSSRTKPSVKTLGYCRLFLRNTGLGGLALFLFTVGLGFNAPAQDNGILARPEGLKFPPLTFEPPAPEQFRVKLKSGPVAYVVPDRERPLVNIVVYVHTGDYLDPEGKEGLADLTGYLLARGGAGTNSADQLEERLAFLAAELDSAINDTQGSVSLNLLSKDVDEGFGILRDVLFLPRFQDDKITLRKQQTMQEMEQRNDDTREIESREAGFLAYGDHFWANRYATSNSIASITKDDLVSFHRKSFAPQNFVVAVSGEFDRDEMIAKLEKLFGGSTLPAATPPPIPTDTVFAKEGAYLVNKPDVNQGRVAIMLPGIMRDNPDYFTIIIMNDILGGGGFTSRIMNRVRTEEGLAYDAHSSFPGGIYYPFTFSVGYQSKSRTVAYAAALAIEEIKKMKSAPVSDLELKTSIGGFIDRFPRTFATKAQVATVFAQEEFTGRYAKDPHFWAKFRSRIGAVTREDIQHSAEKYLDLDKLVVLAVGNKDDILLGFPSHPVKFQDLAGGHFTELPLRDPMTMKPLPLVDEKKP